MKETTKNTYVPPVVEVNPVELDANIALQSPTNRIEMNDWEDEVEVKPDTGDIYISI